MKTGTDQDILQACQAHLRNLQPVKRVEVKYRLVHRDRLEVDGQLVLDTEIGRLRYFYEIKRSLSLPRLEHLLLQLERDSSSKSLPLLLTDYLPPRLAERVVEAGINFVDSAGNAYIHWPGKLYIRVQGARPKRLREAKTGRLFRASGIQVVFVLLAEPRAVSMSYRDLAKASGVALGSVAQVVHELKEKGYLERKGPDQWNLTQKRKLLDLWLSGYGDLLRPKLFMERFQVPEPDLGATLARFQKEAETKGLVWALTGSFASDLLIRHFRGDQLQFFVKEWPADIPNSLKWLPSPRGSVTVLRLFSPPVVFTKHTILAKQVLKLPIAHPLLIYAELVFQGRERELEAAKLVYDRYLASLIYGD